MSRNHFYLRNLIFFVILFITASCKKDCLEKGKCSPSSYSSSYLIEQTTPTATGTTYYIDAENGNKNNDGKSESSSFLEMKQLEGITFEPGDQILFKRNQYHFGEFMLEQSGTVDNRIYIAAYGTGSLPLLKTSKNKKGITLFLSNSDFISIQNLNIQGGANAVLLDGADYAIIAGCRIGEQSESGLRATGKNSNTTGSNNGIIKECLIYSGLSGKLGDQLGTDGIQLMDGASNWHIHHNEFKAWAHSAMSIKAIYTNLNSNNNLVENNLFECGDIDYMRALDITGPEGRASNNIFQKNIIRNQSVTSHLHGNNNTAALNLFLNVKITEASKEPFALDFHVFIGNTGSDNANEYVCFNNHIYNNLFYEFSGGSGVRIYESKDGTTHDVHDNDITNNIFYNSGTAIKIDAEPTNIKIQNNLFFNTNSTSVDFLFSDVNYNLAGLQSQNGTHGFLIENNIEGNPLFLNVAAENFSLQAGSIAIDSGLDVGLMSDYSGNVISGIPEIGPFNF